MNLQDISANQLKEKQTHQERHIFLHKCLDELLSDFIYHTGELPTETKISDFMEWSHSQTINPTKRT